MKVLSSILMLVTLLVSQSLFAGSDHQHGPISESTAQTLALEVAGNLSSRDAGLDFGQLPKTWASVQAKNVEIAKKGKGYYIVSVFNENEKKTLYILMSDGGEVYDANFTGEFEGVK